MKLSEIIQMLASAQRSGMPTDEPEGSRYIQLSETLTNQITAGLEEHARHTAELEGKLQASAEQAQAAARSGIADRVLAGEPWQSGDATVDAEFTAEAHQLAQAASTDELAEQAVLEAVTKRQKLLALAQNTPGIKPATKAVDDDKAKAISHSRRHAGLN